MDNDKIVTHILTLKEQVQRWAPPKKHNDESDGSIYGEATTTHFGHVIVDGAFKENSTNPIQSRVIKDYIDTTADNLQKSLEIKEEIQDDVEQQTTEEKYIIPTAKAVVDKLKNYQSKIIPTQEINSNSTNVQIPSAKAVWDALVNYKDSLKNVAYKTPTSYKDEINNLVKTGYFIMDHDGSPKYLSYANENICYKNALVTVKEQSNRIIQHVYATTKICSTQNPNNCTYKINGAEYKRYGSYVYNSTTNTKENITWKPWHLVHKPYSKTSRAKIKSEHQGVDENSITVYENTAGFIIRWKQTRDQQEYPVHKSLYSYADVCEFDPPLPINGPYVFGNLIGRMDIRITSSKMQIRSNVAPGGRIIGMDETYFVPRNQ